MPLTSSKSRNVRKNSRRRSIMRAPSAGSLSTSFSPWPPRRAHKDADQDQPDECQRNEDLPAQAHYLVVAIARESCTKPQEAKQHKGDLDQQPGHAPSGKPGQSHGVGESARQRRKPAAQKHD